MNFQIKNRFTDTVIFECELPEEIAAQSAFSQLGYAVKQALNARANLAGAYLADAYLADAYLADARNVPETNGSECVTGEQPAEPTDRAERQRQRAARFRERNPNVPVVEALDAKMLAVLESGQGHLRMDSWHTCQTTHCRAGWAITLAGEPGKALEALHGPERAGSMIYRASTGRVPHFFASNERAMEEDIREQAVLQSQGAAQS